MKTAKEMFESLGFKYKKKKGEYYTEYITYTHKFKVYDDVYETYIEFEIFPNKTIAYKHTVNGEKRDHIGESEIEAMYQQMKELGWLDE